MCFKYLLTGANTVMTASARRRHGPRNMGAPVAGLSDLLAARACVT